MTTFLVTGASGFVAAHLLPELLAARFRVRALVRGDAARAAVLRRLSPEQQAAVEFAFGDVTDLATLPPALSGVHGVVHLVAIVRDRSGGRDIARINTGGTLNVLGAMRAAGVRRLVYLGNAGIVDDPRSHFAKSKARAEAAVAASASDWTIVKPSCLWGEGDSFFNILAGVVRVSPLVVVVPTPVGRLQPLWVKDLARVIRISLERADPIGRAYELGGPRYWSYPEVVREVLRGMGARRLLLPLPVAVVGAVAAAAERLHLPFPTTPDQLRLLRLDQIGPLAAVRDAFGFEPRDMAGQLGYLKTTRDEQERMLEAARS